MSSVSAAPTPKTDFLDPAQAKAWEQSSTQTRPARPRFFSRFVEALNAHFTRPFTVLELGSGPGQLAEQIIRGGRVEKYVGVDFSAAMNDLARARVAPLRTDTNFVQRDFRDDWDQGLPRFDCIVTMQSAHEVRHKQHLPALLTKVRDQLVPGGLLLYCDIFNAPGSGKNPDLHTTREEQLALLSGAGFAGVEVLYTEDDMVLYRATNAAVAR